jgi:hypothetical protein
VEFSFVVLNTGNAFDVKLDSAVQTPVGSNYSFSANSGQVLSFNLSAIGTAGFGGMFITPGFPGTYEIRVSNFSGPGLIPEPSSAAFVAGLGVLGCGLLRRRRRV